jgi:hypothetical protein
MIRTDGYYRITLDDRHSFTYNFDFDGVFYSAHRTAYVVNDRGFNEIDSAAGGSRKLYDTRDGADATRRYEELIGAEPRAVHSSEIVFPSTGVL